MTIHQRVTANLSSKIGYHISGPTEHSMYKGWFSQEFLNDPQPGWEVDWDHIDKTTEHMGGILVKDTTSGRVWRLTGENRVNAGQTMWEARWPD